MKINILVFGNLSDIIVKTEFEISDVKDTVELNKKLTELYPALTPIKYALAINKKVVLVNTLLCEADTVALLPPFSGG